MKQLPRTILYNLMIITIFFVIYLIISEQFLTNDKKKVTTLDLLNLSITLQTSVGYTFVNPTTTMAKFILTLQQLLLVFGNLFILHL
jgi:hypothetical protein